MAKGNSKIGAWAFIIGVIIAVILGLSPDIIGSWGTPILVILGLIIGFLNITGKEAMSFLLATISLIIIAGLGGKALETTPYIPTVLNSVMVLAMPAGIIVALKAIYTLAKD